MPTPAHPQVPKKPRGFKRWIQHPGIWMIGCLLLNFFLIAIEPYRDPATLGISYKLVEVAFAFSLAVWISRDSARKAPGWPADLVFLMPTTMLLAYLISAPRWRVLALIVGGTVLVLVPVLGWLL